MARILAQTVTLVRPAPTALRGLATKVKVIEIDLSEEDASSSPVDLGRIRRLEHAIHGLVVRRATPDWLPFVPGGSFWVPPPPATSRPTGVADLLSRMKAASRAEGALRGGAVDMVEIVNGEDEAISFPLSVARGWPSVSFFLEGKFRHSRKISTFEELSKKTWNGATQTDDEES